MNSFNPKKIRVVSFDVFDTLLNAKNYHVDACKIILERFNATHINVDEFHQYWDLLIGNAWEKLNDINQEFLTQKEFFLNVVEQLFLEYNISGDPKVALQIWWDLLDEIKLFEEVPEVLEKLKEKGYIVVILSNIDNDFLYKKLEEFNIKNKFDYIFTSEDLRSYKPNSIIFQKVLNRLQINSNEIIHIGDSQHADILGSKNLGFYSVYINRKNRKIKNLIPLPDFNIKSLREILNIL